MPSRSRTCPVRWVWLGAPVAMGQCGSAFLPVSGEEALVVTLAHSQILSCLGNGKAISQNAVEHLNPGLFLLIQRCITNVAAIFAEQLAGGSIDNNHSHYRY